MPIEKRASEGPTPQNVKELVKQAHAEGKTLVINMWPVLEKEAVVVVATGDRAKQLREILEACD